MHSTRPSSPLAAGALRRGARRLAALCTALLASCTTAPPPAPAPQPTPAQPPVAGPVPAAPGSVPPVAAYHPQPSGATNPRDYRKDAAAHLYALNADRIYKGRMPPMLYAIGVLQVEIDRRGNVTALNWMRPPRHAMEVVAEIERTARAAAPYPVPTRLGRVTYTDTWLWDKSGKFQLDTLTEGQN